MVDLKGQGCRQQPLLREECWRVTRLRIRANEYACERCARVLGCERTLRAACWKAPRARLLRSH